MAEIKTVERQTWIDAVKGMGIIFVVLGHTYGIYFPLYKFIYSFHMPLFFIVSGFLYNNNKYNKLDICGVVKKKFKDYIIPYFTFCFCNLLLQCLWKLTFLRTKPTFGEILNYIKGILICYADKQHMPNCSPVWFLMCLFWSSIIFYLIMKYARKYAFIIMASFMAVSYLIDIFTDIRLPFNLSTAFMAQIFMYTGFLLRKYEVLNRISNIPKRRSYLIITLIFVISVIISQVNGIVGFNENTYSNLFLFLIPAISLSFITMYIAKYNRFFRNKFFVFLGKNTLIIIGFNFFAQDFVTEFYYLIPIIKKYPIHWFTQFLFTIAFLILLIFCVNKIKAFIRIRKFS